MFILNETDCQLAPRSLLSVDPASSDLEADIVITRSQKGKMSAVSLQLQVNTI